MNGLTCKYCAHLKKCIKADNDKGYEHNENFEGEKFCREFKRNTNADRIRSLSDEELAEFLYTSVSCYGCPVRAECDKTACKGCDELVLEWLQQSAKEDA